MKALMLIALILTLCAISPASSSQPQETGALGIGLDSCVNYLRNTKDTNKLGTKYQPWILGFLTGMNIKRTPSTKTISLPDPKLITNYLNYYCKKNPSNPVVEGAMVLYLNLLKTTGK